jgi:prolyl-tRNA editing enzyme YbaK/EbsC (Cys-tRNA(Pro) deacylase)
MTDGDDLLPSRLRGWLKAHDVGYQVIACDPDYADTAAFCARYGVAPEDSANTIVVTSKRGPQRQAACVVLATTRLDVNRTVCRVLNVPRASFASADQTRELTGMMIGGVTPFGLPDGLPLLVDARVMTRPTVVVGGGSRSAKLRIRPDDLLRVPDATVVEGLASLPPESAARL